MANMQWTIVGISLACINFAVQTNGDSATTDADVTRVTIKSGDKYIAECMHPPSQGSRRRRSSETTPSKPRMTYGIDFLEAKFIGTGNATCRESSIKNFLRTKFCTGSRQQGCPITAPDPLKECGNRPLSLVYKCGMIEWIKGNNHRGTLVGMDVILD
ncbi:uncharacterized protein LOC129595426 [Paramacrobiotus metropolitanus]|uniref:uncharacterized protein LOC129595426 n=1 Tax=Paramacrobiotus metropolitanus TaxID=2943436 RepID=UPI002445A514|nr:uncharacterized protein LOC129595426 [Paramacrobiotus metropolitanus]